MLEIAWYRGIWATLWVLILSTIITVLLSQLVAFPSTCFDILISVMNICLVAFATRWYFGGYHLHPSAYAGFMFGTLLLCMQALLGILLGIVYSVLNVLPAPVSVHPLVLFTLTLVLTIGTTSAVGALYKK